MSQFRKPEKWLLNLFEDSLKEVLETTRLPCNVSKINDCMKRLDPTYNLSETGKPLHIDTVVLRAYQCLPWYPLHSLYFDLSAH